MLTRRFLLIALALTLGLTALAGADTFATTWHRSWIWSGAKITGTILTPTGQPSVGTSVTVTQTNPDGSNPILDAQTTTTATGQYTLVVNRNPSRILTVNAAGNTRIIVESTAPNISLHIYSHRSRVLVFTGRIFAAGLLPAVILQDHIPASPGMPPHWQDFANATPGPNGFYRATYDAPPGSITRFQVRAITAVVPGTLDAGVSGTHWAHLR